MTEAFTPLSAEETVAAAHRIFATVDAALTIRRGLEKVSDRELLSMVIFLRQLDAIARAAALFSLKSNDHALWVELQELLLVPGYLPLPVERQQEPAHVQD